MQLTMESRGPLPTSCWLLPPLPLPPLLLLLLPLPPHTRQGLALRHILPTQRAQDPPAMHLSNGPGQEPVTVLTFNLSRIAKTSSSFEVQTWDQEGVIFYGDTNPKDDWFMLGLRDGRPEIQMHSHWAQLTVGAGPRLDDGRWHQVKIRNHGDSVLLEVDGEEVLHLRQVSGSLNIKPQTIMRIAVGGLLFPLSSLRLPVSTSQGREPWPEACLSLPWMDGCLRRGSWLDPQAQISASTLTSLRSCGLELQPGLFFPSGTHTEFSLQDIPQPYTEPWAFSLDLGLKLAAGSGHLLALGTPENPSWLSLHLQDQKVVLSAGSGPGLDLPLVMGLPLQLKLGMSRVVLSQGPKTEVLALPPLGLGPLISSLWAQSEGHLFLGALPGEDPSASFCLDGLWVQGQKLDMDQALSRSQDIWTHSCPQSPGKGTDTSQ